MKILNINAVAVALVITLAFSAPVALAQDEGSTRNDGNRLLNLQPINQPLLEWHFLTPRTGMEPYYDSSNRLDRSDESQIDYDQYDYDWNTYEKDLEYVNSLIFNEEMIDEELEYMNNLMIDVTNDVDAESDLAYVVDPGEDYADMENHGEFYGIDAGDGPYGYYAFEFPDINSDDAVVLNQRESTEAETWLESFISAVDEAEMNRQEFENLSDIGMVYVVDVLRLTREIDNRIIGRGLVENRDNVEIVQELIDDNSKMEEIIDEYDIDQDNIIALDVANGNDVVLFYYDGSNLSFNSEGPAVIEYDF